MQDAPFEIVSELGKGGMGLVYEVRLPGDPRAHVAKLMTATGEHARERFRREGELVARLDDHPGIVRAINAGFLREDVPYIIFEKAEGEPLGKLMRRSAPLPVERALEIASQLAAALGHAHARGVIHRDVKPDNIIIDPEGRVRLLDFGLAIARDLERLTQTGHTVGTPRYMACEQIDGTELAVGPWTDVHAVGLVLYECLLGESPFDATDPMVLLGQVIAREPESVREQRREVEEGLDAVVACCLQKDPAERYADGCQLLADLERVARGEAPLALRQSRSRLRRGQLSWLAGALFLSGLVGGVAFVRSQRAGAAPEQLPEVGTAGDPASLMLAEAEGWAVEQPGRALRTLERVRALGPEPALAWRELACRGRAFLALGKSERVSPVIEELRALGAPSQLSAELVDGLYRGALREPASELLAALDRISAQGSVSEPALAREVAFAWLAATRARLEEPGYTDPFYSVVSKTGGAPEVREALMRYYASIGQIQRAAPRVDLLDHEGLLYLGKCFAEAQDIRYNPERDGRESRAFFLEIQEALPDDPLLSAARALSCKPPDEALEQAQRALAGLDRTAGGAGAVWLEVRDEVVVRMAQLLDEAGRDDEAAALLAAEARREQAGPRVLISQGRRLLAAGRADEARALAERANVPAQVGHAVTPLSSWYKERDDLLRRVAGGEE